MVDGSSSLFSSILSSCCFLLTHSNNVHIPTISSIHVEIESTTSSAKPLSSLTFYLRHQRRGVLMILGTALMVLGITFPVFLLSAMTSAMRPYMEYLQQVSVISPIHSELDPGVVGQIRRWLASFRPFRLACR